VFPGPTSRWNFEWLRHSFQADRGCLDRDQDYTATKSDIVDDATSRQKAIATSTEGLNKNVEAFIVTDVIGLAAENHVETARTLQEMTEDLDSFDDA